jgi:hypothetical protein
MINTWALSLITNTKHRAFTKPSGPGQSLRPGSATTPPSCLGRTLCSSSRPLTVPTPGKGRERSSPPSALDSDKEQACHTDPARTEGTSVTIVRSDAIPATRNADKTTPPSNDSQYGGPSSKYAPTRRMYDPSHYGMGSITMTLI